jgi:hypothetical protein
MDRAGIGDFSPGRYLKMSTTPTSCDRQAPGAKKKRQTLGFDGLGLRCTTCPQSPFLRVGALLRRYRPVPGILAARRPGAIMDKSGPPGLITSHVTKAAEISAEKKSLKVYPLNPQVLPMY